MALFIATLVGLAVLCGIIAIGMFLDRPKATEPDIPNPFVRRSDNWDDWDPED